MQDLSEILQRFRDRSNCGGEDERHLDMVHSPSRERWALPCSDGHRGIGRPNEGQLAVRILFRIILTHTIRPVYSHNYSNMGTFYKSLYDP